MGPSGTIPSYHQLVKRRRPSDVTFVRSHSPYSRSRRTLVAHHGSTAHDALLPHLRVQVRWAAHIVNLKGRPLRNGPTEEQLNTTPNDQGQRDFYRLIDKETTRSTRDFGARSWVAALLREVGGKQQEDKWQQCILWELPENYVLYEHIKTKADGQLKTVKNHSGGGHS
ncbi:unnamed protein product [Alternaria alternata]